MIHTTHIQEDQIVIIDILDAQNAEVTVQDCLTGKTEKVSCTTAEIGATMALAYAGDEAEFAQHLYPLAEQLAARFSDRVLRIIP